jgi:hypothetical protein
VAQRIRTFLIDDLSGEELENGETIQFAWKHTTYEVDLSDENAEAFQRTIAPWIAISRRIGGRVPKAHALQPDRGPAVIDSAQRASIREWANEQGFTVSKRGRISQDILDAYQARFARKAG